MNFGNGLPCWSRAVIDLDLPPTAGKMRRVGGVLASSMVPGGFPGCYPLADSEAPALPLHIALASGTRRPSADREVDLWKMRCSPMDRLTRSMTGTVCGLGLLLTASGCKMTRPEVPPGRAYSKDGRQQPAIGFSSEGHPLSGAATTAVMPDTAGGSKMAPGASSNSERPNMSPLLEGGSGAFGPPGTAGREEAAGAPPTIGRTTPVGDDLVLPAGAPDLPRPSISPLVNPPSTTQPASTGAGTLPPDIEPRAEIAPPASQVVQPGVDDPGKMGRGNDLPSPN